MTVPMIRSIGDVPYPIDTHSDTFSPLLTTGAALGITGDGPTETAAWLQRTSTSDGPTTAKSIHGRTLRWNQLVSDSDTSVTVPSGHKYVARIDGTTTLATSDGTAITVTGGTDNVFDLTAMFGAGSEPSTIEEFTALYPLPYYPYDAGSLLPVNMTGIETTGFNIFDEQWQVGGIAWATGAETTNTSARRSDFIPVFPDTDYYFVTDDSTTFGGVWYGADKEKVSGVGTSLTSVLKHSPTDAYYVRIAAPMAVEQGHVCVNLSDPTRNGEYEPYWRQTRTIPAGTLRSAGTVYDELTATERITRIGERAYQSGDESDPTVVTDGTVTHYALATPTTVEIDPPLNLTYRTEQGGSERVMVPAGEQSAPPTIVTAQGYTAESLRDAALSAIAPVENGLASTNYAVGSYLVHGGQLCKVTTAIATGESISIGTNVTATTVMAEVIALIAQ